MTLSDGQRDESAILGVIELHSVDELRDALDSGLDAGATVRGRTLVGWLMSMYTRGERFAGCMRLLLERGAVLDDPVLAPVLLNDEHLLRASIRSAPSLVDHRTSLNSAFTPLIGASLLHVAAEFGHAGAARVLIDMGADVDAPAATDEYGLNGHTPIFHTVNSNANHAAPVLAMLLEAGARTDILLRGITWGRGFDWETTLFDVTPISYAQFGLLPQMHRREADVSSNVQAMLEAASRPIPPLPNVPNRYLRPRTT